MKYTIQLLSFFALLLLYACRSPLSEGKPDAISSIQAKIALSQYLTNKNDNSVSVSLYDAKGRPIRNKDIKIKLNEVDLTYIEKQDLYYTKTTSYSASNFPVKELYILTITLTDGQSHFLASITPLAESKATGITLGKANLQEDFVLSWQNLHEVNELTMMKSVLLKTSTAKDQNYSYDEPVTAKIGSSGRYVIPKSTYSNSKWTLSSVEIQFNASKLGKVNKELIKGSEITISGQLKETVDFDEHSLK